MRRGIAISLVAVASFAGGILVDRYLLPAKGPSYDPLAAKATTPALVSPADGEVLANGWKNPVWHFRWSDVQKAEKYQLQITSPRSNEPWVDEFVDEPRYDYAARTVFADGSLEGWKWKVRSEVGGQWSKWSESRSFNLREAVSDDYPSKEELLAYLDGKSIKLTESGKPEKTVVLNRGQIDGVQVEQSVSSGASHPWGSTPVNLVIRADDERYAVRLSVLHQRIEGKRVFKSFEVLEAHKV